MVTISMTGSGSADGQALAPATRDEGREAPGPGRIGACAVELAAVGTEEAAAGRAAAGSTRAAASRAARARGRGRRARGRKHGWGGEPRCRAEETGREAQEPARQVPRRQTPRREVPERLV